MDILTKEQRSFCMSQIRSKNTLIELKFRKYLYNNGIRGYRVNNKILGKPDLYFPKKRIAVFIDGCFWHKCPKCFIKPKSKNNFWDKKIRYNILRDKIINKKLNKDGVKILRFWEHDIKNNIEKCYIKFINLYEKNI